MKLRNAREYIESLQMLNPIVYYKGKLIEDVTTHPATAPHVRAAAMTYELAETEPSLACAVSNLTGNLISRFTHIHQDTEDLITKIKLLEYSMVCSCSQL